MSLVGNPYKNRRTQHKLTQFYKITHGSVPSYLSAHLPPPNTSSYSLRNTVTLYRCNTEKFRGSFFPSMTKLWHSLPEDIRTIDDINLFKQKVRSQFCPPLPPKHYGCGPRYASTIHTCLRLKHNGLYYNMYRVGLSNSPACLCGEREETESHYLLDCPLHTDHRAVMLNHISDTVAEYVDIHNMLRSSRQTVANILLFGNTDLSYEANVSIFNEVCNYIISTQRFMR